MLNVLSKFNKSVFLTTAPEEDQNERTPPVIKLTPNPNTFALGPQQRVNKRVEAILTKKPIVML